MEIKFKEWLLLKVIFYLLRNWGGSVHLVIVNNMNLWKYLVLTDYDSSSLEVDYNDSLI